MKRVRLTLAGALVAAFVAPMTAANAECTTDIDASLATVLETVSCQITEITIDTP